MGLWNFLKKLFSSSESEGEEIADRFRPLMIKASQGEYPEVDQHGNPISNIIELNISGTTFTHLGCNPSDVIPKLSIGENLILAANPENDYDAMAVRVMTQRGEQIGWIPRACDEKPLIFRRLQEGYPVCCFVSNFGRMKLNGNPWCEIVIVTYVTPFDTVVRNTSLEIEMEKSYRSLLPEQSFEQDIGYGYWLKGDEERKNGNIEEALRLFDKAKEAGYDYPVIYESYAMAYRKLKDFDREIAILDEAIKRFDGETAESFRYRRSRAEYLASVSQRKLEEIKQKALARAQKAIEREEREKAKKNRQPPGRPVLQCTDDGEVLMEYPSISKAAEKTGVNAKSIREAANGRQKHAGGYCWRYVSSPSASDADSQNTLEDGEN